MSLENFHPIIREWFETRFDGPTEPQIEGWPDIATGKHTLIAAPTGSGKTLTAFLSVIDRLYKERLSGETEEFQTRVIYISPLRALSNDMRKNLETPLREIESLAAEKGTPLPKIHVGLRTGDTPSSERVAMTKKPPHIIVTTPESFFLLLTAQKSREILASVDTVIVDEIHALVRDKRGSHLALSLERLEALTPHRIQRIGLSATQRPLSLVADFLVGQGRRKKAKPPQERQKRLFEAPVEKIDNKVSIIDVGHQRELDLEIVTPPSELSAVCSNEQWEEINEKIVELINSHRSTLIFVNTRRMAERISHQLTKLLGEGSVCSHHGSLSYGIRLETEQRLKSGQIKAVVATASLELGIDVGYIDLVIQIGSPRSIATFLQRIGRSGHALGLIPKGRFVALTRDELIEAMALIRAIAAGRLDVLQIRDAPLDVLAQQIVAEIANEEWSTDELFEQMCCANCYRNLKRSDFDSIIQMLSEGITSSAGRSRVYLHHDQVQKRIRSRKSARLVALNNAGAIPEWASYKVVTAGDEVVVGTLDEDFASESQAGDIFMLGNNSWRIKNIRGGVVTVFDAHGAPPTVPFWFGEAPGRTLELSEEISKLREEIGHKASQSPELLKVIVKELSEETHCDDHAANQAVEYIASQCIAVGLVPSQKRILFERFFDQSGGMQVVVHAPFGSRITKAWGLAMRKRFCRSFDFELQATADDDGFILSLGPQHSFPLESLFPMLTAENVEQLLIQALLDVPTFELRWRWNVTNSLLVARRQNGKKVPPPLLRFKADDLLTAVFPKLTGCQENITGDHVLPDHPLVNQTVDDCLNEALDIEALKKILREIQTGEITIVGRDTREPSPFSYELLNANAYAFLDGGEAIERRARAVQTRRSVVSDEMDDLGRLDPGAIESVTQEAIPLVRDSDELHDLLLTRFILPVNENPARHQFFPQLKNELRADLFHISENQPVWVAAERLPVLLAAFPEIKDSIHTKMHTPETVQQQWTSTEARVAIIRGLMECSGPLTGKEVAARTGLAESQCNACLEALEGEGLVLRGQFRPKAFLENADIEWCHRRLLARIHRRTVQGLRKQIEPVDIQTYVRFLSRHQAVLPEKQRIGAAGVFEAVGQLQGLDLPARLWETDILPVRTKEYHASMLDELCFTGEVGWGRLYPPKRDATKSRPMVALSRNAPVSLFLREDLPWLQEHAPKLDEESLSSSALEVLELFQQKGAMFASDLSRELSALPSQLTDSLSELVSKGFLSADGFSGLRGLLGEQEAKPNHPFRRGRTIQRRRQRSIGGQIGRWSLWRNANEETQDTQEKNSPFPISKNPTTEDWAWQLLRRWGVMFRDLLQREAGAPPWYDLLQVYRRLEARGEIRGGRFIQGVAGEQFSSGDTIKQLRELRDNEHDDELLVLSAADPLNLEGILTTSHRIPAIATNKIALLNGDLVACYKKSKTKFFRELPTIVSLEIQTRFEGRPWEKFEFGQEQLSKFKL